MSCLMTDYFGRAPTIFMNEGSRFIKCLEFFQGKPRISCIKLNILQASLN